MCEFWCIVVVGVGIVGFVYVWLVVECGYDVMIYECNVFVCGVFVRNFGMVWLIG